MAVSPKTTDSALAFAPEINDDTTSARRAENGGVVKPGTNRFEYVVRLVDSDTPHVVEMYRQDGRYFGECSCKGYKYNEGPCAHLLWMWHRDKEPAPVVDVADLTEPLNDHRCANCGEPLPDGGR